MKKHAHPKESESMMLNKPYQDTLMLQSNKKDKQAEEINLKYVNSIDLDQISLSTSDSKLIDKFFIRKNYALALTKKKEVLYWGKLIEDSKELTLFSQSSQFMDTLIVKKQNQTQSFSQDSAYYTNEDISKHQQQSLLSKRISFFKGIKVNDVCCNDFAAHFLTEDGLLYTMGKDQKKYGLLGLGAVYDMPTPHPNNSLIDFRLSKISMGLSHCCALTTSGQLYTWGTGQNGQLCLSDETMFSNIPKLVANSKYLSIQNIYCSNYYTIIVNSKGQLTLYGTLKGFAKFLYDSPTKDETADVSNLSSGNNSRTSDRVIRQKLNLGEEIVTKVCVAERAFVVYCQDTCNIFFIDENFEVTKIMQREIKSMQFVNGQKYIVIQDSNDILIVMQQLTDNKFEIVQEFNLIQRFNTQEVELLPQDTSITTKKAQSLQLLTFIAKAGKSQMNNFNKKYYKTFLTKQISNNNYQDMSENSILNESRQKKTNTNSPYCNSSAYKTRNRLRNKIDSIFGQTFSASKNRSTSIQERAKKLHQSLSPISRFPMINNLCEIIKKQQMNSHPNNLVQTASSPSKINGGLNLINQSINEHTNIVTPLQDSRFANPQYNLFLKSLNLACQISSMGNGQPESEKQLKFLSKAEQIRIELQKKANTNKQGYNLLASTTNFTEVMSSMQHQDLKRSMVSSEGAGLKVQDLNLPLQIKNSSQVSEQDQSRVQSLTCIQEDKENTTIVATQRNLERENTHKSNTKPHLRQTSLNIQEYPMKLVCSTVKKKQEIKEILNIDTISEISVNYRESMHRFSSSAITNTNNYKILVMNARNVLEKKILQHLMFGFNTLKYHHASNSFQSFQLQSVCSQPTLNQSFEQRMASQKSIEQGLALLSQTVYKYNLSQKAQALICLYNNLEAARNQSKALKKIAQLARQKQDQFKIESLRKIQLIIRYKKLQRLNINLMFNCVNKIHKKLLKESFRKGFQLFKGNLQWQRKMQGGLRIKQLVEGSQKRKGFNGFIVNNKRISKIKKGIELMTKVQVQIQNRKSINTKSKVIYLMKRNVIQTKKDQLNKLANLKQKLITKECFNIWNQSVIKRKAAIQQAIFLKMFVQDKMKQSVYQAILKILNYSNSCRLEQPHLVKQFIPIQESQVPQLVLKEEQYLKLLNIENNIINENIVQQYRKFELEQQEIFKHREDEQEIDDQQLDIEDTQLEEEEENYYYFKKNPPYNKNRQIQPASTKVRGEFSFEKYDSSNNVTAHFNKLMSGRGGTTSQSKKTQHKKQNYHCHYANQEQEIEDDFVLTLDINQRRDSANQSSHLNNKENLSQTSRIKMNIQNEISPSNNCKNYQRQANLNKNYEQSDPFELPMNEYEGFPRFHRSRDQEEEKQNEVRVLMKEIVDHSNIADDGAMAVDIQNRYSIKNVVPFNPPEDTPSDTYLRNKQQLSDQKQQMFFDSKKPSNASSQANSQSNSVKSTFINNYFQKLSAQNSAQRKQNPNLIQQTEAQQQVLPPTPKTKVFTPKEHKAPSTTSSQINHQQQQNQHPQASFITNNNNIDFMHFHSLQSEASFVFFDDNFLRDSGISSASRITNNIGRIAMNQSFGSQNQFQAQQLKSSIGRNSQLTSLGSIQAQKNSIASAPNQYR